MYPALAVAAALTDGSRCTYIGSADGMERSLVARESQLPFEAVPAAAIRGRNPLALLRNSATLAHGVQVARRLIQREQPASILGTGGYVCVPVFLAARMLGIPTILYLPDLVPGLAIRMLERISSVMACSVLDSQRFFRRRVATSPADAARPPAALLVTGYPVRPELLQLDRQACRAAFEFEEHLPVLLVYGGSRGARSINHAIGALLADILPIAQVLHICGREGDEQHLQGVMNQLPAPLRQRYRLFPYLHNQAMARSEYMPGQSMSSALGAADLVIGRSGASILGELPIVGLPAILVPYPYVHQDENADYLVRQKAAFKVADQTMLGTGRPVDGMLFPVIQRLLSDSAERERMAASMRQLAQPAAAQRLADTLLALAARRSNP